MMFQQIIIPPSSQLSNPGRIAMHVEYFHTPHCIPSTIHDPSHHTINNSTPISSLYTHPSQYSYTLHGTCHCEPYWLTTL